jgi:hypothetical protein
LRSAGIYIFALFHDFSEWQGVSSDEREKRGSANSEEGTRKMKALKIACLAAALTAMILPAGAQNSPGPTAPEVAPTPPIHKPLTINQRRENQQDRIAQGVKSGQLTAGETANLETKEAAINKEVRADRQANGGKLTQAERAQVNRQLNRTSKQIYRDKHNAAHQ